MKIINIIAIFFLSIVVLAQEDQSNQFSNNNNSKLVYISPRKVQLGDSVLTVEETKNYLAKYPKSFNLYKKGRGNRTLGTILMAIGGGVIVGNAISNLSGASDGPVINGTTVSEQSKEGTPIPYFVGAGLIGGGIPILISGKKKIKESIELYNSEYVVNKTTINLLSNNNGVGLALVF